MTTFYLALTLVASFIIIYAMVWKLFTKESRLKIPPFVSVEWLAWLVYVGYYIGMMKENGVYFIFFVIALIASFATFRRWQKVSLAKEAAKASSEDE